MSKIAFYCRVSTQEQGKKNTIETQISQLNEKYQNPVKIYTDICSGSYLPREGLNQLREDAKKGLFDTIAVYSLDRLSRKLGHQIALMEEFERQGIKVEVLGENYENTPEGMLNRNIRGAFAEYERYKIAKRNIDGKIRKAEAGKLVGTAPPFGYKYIKATSEKEAHFEINPKEAEIVKLIFNLYLSEQSLWGTAKKIYRMGIKVKTRRSNEPIYLSKQTIGKILQNESYIGNYYYGKTQVCEAKYHLKPKRKSQLTGRKFRPKSEWKLIKIPAIIDKSVFERVQKIREERKKRHLKPTKHFYLCQGLIKCVRCGRTYTGKRKGKSLREERPNGCHYTYVCPQKFGTHFGEPHCHAREMETRKLDNAVWNYVVSYLRSDEVIERSFQELEEKREKDRGFNQRTYDSLITEKAEIEKKKSRILDLYADGKYNKEDLDKKMANYDSEQKEIENQIKEVERELQRIDDLKAIEELAKSMAREFRKGIDNPTPEYKQFVIRTWVKEINIKDDGVVVIKSQLPALEKLLVERFKLNIPLNSNLMGYYRTFVKK